MVKETEPHPNLIPLPVTRLDRELVADVKRALDREWLLTNGIGGFASASLCGAHTRRYHGLLVAALQPPLGRTLLLSKLDEEVNLAGKTYSLDVNEWRGSWLGLRGLGYLESCEFLGNLPTFTYRLDDATFTKTIWMEHGLNTTYVRYHYEAADQATPLELHLRPLASCRDYHGTLHGTLDQSFRVTPKGNASWQIQAWPDAPEWWLLAFDRPVQWRGEAGGGWYWGFHYRQEQARGLSADEDLYGLGTFVTTLEPGQSLTLVASTTDPETVRQLYPGAYERELARQGALLSRSEAVPPAASSENTATPKTSFFKTALLKRFSRSAAVPSAPTETVAPKVELYFTEDNPIDQLAARLWLAADQFIVGRPDPTRSGHLWADYRTVIAGYHWFSDWGRDTMISLPGLTLVTGRYAEAATILRSFARFVSEGMLPNRFPDSPSEFDLDENAYNTVDATLWYFDALDKYLTASGDVALGRELYPTLAEIIRCHLQGTRFNIKVSDEDGLLSSGAPGVQLTWMDAKVGEWVITPRRGKPIEISALWYRACRVMQKLAAQHGSADDAECYQSLADKVAVHFERVYWHEEGGYLYDLIDEYGQPDPALRPNQVIAIAVAPELVSLEKRRQALAHVREYLLTPYGLRSLSRYDPSYHATYSGDPMSRDSAYHQGTIWSWLLAPYARAMLQAGMKRDDLIGLLTPFLWHLDDAGIGQISEIFEADSPFSPVGCIAQAWSVAALLEIWQMFNE